MARAQRVRTSRPLRARPPGRPRVQARARLPALSADHGWRAEAKECRWRGRVPSARSRSSGAGRRAHTEERRPLGGESLLGAPHFVRTVCGQGAASGAPTRGFHAVGSGPGDGALSGVARIQPPMNRPTSATIALTWPYCPSDTAEPPLAIRATTRCGPGTTCWPPGARPPAANVGLALLRLTCHAGSAQVALVADGIPWLGFVVFPQYRRVKGHNVVNARRRLHRRIDDYRQGRIAFGVLDASVQGWVNHVRYADSWGLRRHVFAALPPIIPPDRRESSAPRVLSCIAEPEAVAGTLADGSIIGRRTARRAARYDEGTT